MMNYELSHTEEHYLKAICLLSEKVTPVPAKAVAVELGASQPSVSEMLRRLEEKGFLAYKPYQGIQLSPKGKTAALHTLRIQRLWEVFLVDKLSFSWDEVHEATEELEHVRSDKVINRLEEYLGYPKFDPHGDPIPDPRGRIVERSLKPLASLKLAQTGVIAGVTLYTRDFLNHLDRFDLKIGANITIKDILSFDQSTVAVCNDKEILLSKNVCEHIMVSVQNDRM